MTPTRLFGSQKNRSRDRIRGSSSLPINAGIASFRSANLLLMNMLEILYLLLVNIVSLRELLLEIPYSLFERHLVRGAGERDRLLPS